MSAPEEQGKLTLRELMKNRIKMSLFLETRSQPTPGPSQPQPLPHLATEEKDDTWTTREKLVLALCVVTRGDQNW